MANVNYASFSDRNDRDVHTTGRNIVAGKRMR